MHVQSMRLKYFKRFRDKHLDFTDPETGLARNLVVLVGENGSGKSTVLQAIAATLGTATRRFESPAELVIIYFLNHFKPSSAVLNLGEI
jgi:predicted ATP-binding protein involved in virulence